MAAGGHGVDGPEELGHDEARKGAGYCFGRWTQLPGLGIVSAVGFRTDENQVTVGP